MSVLARPCRLSAIGTWIGYVAYILLYTLLHPHLSNLSEVPGPKRESFLWGSLPTILEAEPGRPGVKWMDEFGSVVRYTGFFGCVASSSSLSVSGASSSEALPSTA